MIQWSSAEEANQFLQLACEKIPGSPFMSIERSMEVQGVLSRPVWVHLRGVPAHARNKEVFRLLGNCFGHTVLVDSKTILKEDVEVGRVKVFKSKPGHLPESLSLWVEDIKFSAEIRETNDTPLASDPSTASSKGSLPVGLISKFGFAGRMDGEEWEKGEDGVSDDVSEGDSNFESPFGWHKLILTDSNQMVGQKRWTADSDQAVGQNSPFENLA